MAHNRYDIDRDVAQIIKNRGYSEKEGMAIKSLAKDIITESQALKICLGADVKIGELNDTIAVLKNEANIDRSLIRKLKSDLEDNQFLIVGLYEKIAKLQQFINKHRNSLAEFLEGDKN